MRRMLLAASGAAAAVLGIRLVRSRHRRSLHPDGRSFAGELEVFRSEASVGAGLLDRPSRYPVIIRLSKGIGTRRGRPDVRGLAVRISVNDTELDLLLSTMGRRRTTRHLPAVRRSFDVGFGSITSYRIGSGRKVYLSAGPDPDSTPLGATLESVVDAARHGAALLLYVDDYRSSRTWGRISFGSLLSQEQDATLAFDPVRRSSADLHPSGTIHGIRAYAYRLSQRWRGMEPAAPDPGAVERTVHHR